MRLLTHKITMGGAFSFGVVTLIAANNSFFIVTSLNTNVASVPRPRRYFASCIPGLERSLAKEIEQIGGHNVELGRSGVTFTEAPTTTTIDKNNVDPLTGTSMDMQVGLKCLLWTRTCHRLMELIATTLREEEEDSSTYVEYSFGSRLIYDKNDLYEFIQSSCDVKSLLGDGKGGMLSFAVKVTIGMDTNSKNLPKELCHTHFTALTVKNALVDKCRMERSDGARPDVNIENPDVPILVALRASSSGGGGAHVSVYRSLNGFESLHKHGYRAEDNAIHKAAMKESMASGLLYECGWHLLVAQAKKDGMPALLVDPMTGSGTFCIEAAMMAADVAPGLMRLESMTQTDKGNNENDLWRPPALRWRSSDASLWKRLIQEAQEREKKGRKWIIGKNPITGQRNCRILGNEINESAYKLALQGSQRANFSSVIEFRKGNCEDWKLAEQIIEARTIVVANPPWGLRLNEEEADVDNSWLALKTFLREECVGAEAWVLSGNRDLTRLLKMKKTRSVPLSTAAESLRWLQYHIFQNKPASKTNTVEMI